MNVVRVIPREAAVYAAQFPFGADLDEGAEVLQEFLDTAFPGEGLRAFVEPWNDASVHISGVIVDTFVEPGEWVVVADSGHRYREGTELRVLSEAQFADEYRFEE